MNGCSYRGPLTGGLLPLLVLSLLLSLAAPPSVPGAPEAAWACKYRRSLPTRVPIRKVRRATVCVINHKRAERGLPRLDRVGDLAGSSQRHTRYMHEHDCFSHRCPGEADLYGRISRTGYFSGARSYGCGENIATRSRRGSTPRSVVRAWMRSDSHRRTLFGTWEHAGVGVKRGSPWRSKANAATYTLNVCRRSR